MKEGYSYFTTLRKRPQYEKTNRNTNKPHSSWLIAQELVKIDLDGLEGQNQLQDATTLS